MSLNDILNFLSIYIDQILSISFKGFFYFNLPEEVGVFIDVTVLEVDVIIWVDEFS